MRIAVIYNEKKIDPNDVINVFGMPTKEHYNPITVERVAKALEKGGHTVKVVEGDMHAIDKIKEFMPKVVSGERPGMVFNMAYGIQGRNRYTHVPAMMEMLGLPYVGSGPEAHAIVQDKVMTKIVLQKHHLPTPGFWVFSTSDDKFDDLTFPVIVKPKMESTSMGMKVVDNWDNLRDAVKEQMEQYSQDILVEQFIPGREFAVGIIGNRGHIEVLPIVELDLGGDPNKIQTKTDKMKQPLEKICPAKLSPEQEKEMKRLCIDAYNKLGLYDFARVDLRMDKEGMLYILELNSMASLGLTGTYVHAAKTAGYTYESLINKMLEVAALRYFGDSVMHSPQLEEKDVIEKPLRTIIRSYLRSHHTTTEKLLRQLVSINTNPQNIEEVNRAGQILSKRLEHLGFKVHHDPQFDVGNFLYFTNHDDVQNDVLLLSHIDTWYSNQDFTAFQEVGSKLYGSGIAESKGGLAIMISALQALRFARRLRKIKIGILLTTDDSLGGRFSKRLVEETSKKSRYVIELKWGTLEGGIVTSCSGMTRYNIDMSHIRRADPTTRDVIPDMCKKIVAWKKLSEKEKDAQISPSLFSARTSYGSSPDYGHLLLETRYRFPEQRTKFDNEIRRIAKKREKVKLEIHISKSISRPPVTETEQIKKFYEMTETLAKRIDVKVKPIHRYATSDICHVPDNIPVLGGMGPLGADYRSPSEHILRDSMIDRGALLALVINRCRKTDQK